MGSSIDAVLLAERYFFRSAAVPGAVISAIENALEPFGVRLLEFPLSPPQLFELIDSAGRACKH